MNRMSAIRYVFLVMIFGVQTATAQIRVLAVTDSATFTPGIPYAGSLATVFCTGLTAIHGIQNANGFPLPYELSGVSVYSGGGLAPLLAVADMGTYQQINYQAPYSVDPPAQTFTVEVRQYDRSGQIHFPVDQQTWGVFFTDASGYALAQHADYSLITQIDPAVPGEVVILWATNATGLYQIYNAPPF